jgi:hypothetical protein
MSEPTDPDARLATRAKRWAVVRLLLGQAQMIGAVAAAYLLIQTGMNELSLGAVVFTCACTTVSVLLFGGRRSR